MRVLSALVCAAIIAVGPARAQVAPSAGEITAYDGLLAAAARGDASGVEALAKSGARLDQRDGHGRTAVHVAAHGSHDDVVRALAKAGADLNAKDSRQYDIVTIVSVTNDVALLSIALSLGASARQITSPYDGTALIAAAHLGHADVVRQLIAAGAPLDHVNNLGWTALMESIVLGDGGRAHQDTLKALLDAGADHTVPDRDGVTPLEHAKRRGYTDMVAMLTAAKRPSR
jgi:uncharacterized protein